MANKRRPVETREPDIEDLATFQLEEIKRLIRELEATISQMGGVGAALEIDPKVAFKIKVRKQFYKTLKVKPNGSSSTQANS